MNQAWERFAAANGAPSPDVTGVGASYLDVCRRAKGPGSDYAATALAGVSAVLEGRSNEFCLEYPCHSTDEKRWFLLTTVRLRADFGAAVCSHSDITERVLAEQKAAQTAAFYRALLENALDVVTIIDPEGIIRYHSPSAERVLGFRPDELLGTPALDLVHPTEVPEIRRVLRDLQNSAGGTSTTLDVRLRHKDGHWRVLEGVAKNALSDPSVGGIVVTSRDVSERRQAEAALREKEAALRNSRQALHAVTSRLFEAEETERRRVSRELHDDLNQKLAVIAMDTGSLARTLPQSDAAQVEKELRSLQSRLNRICGQVRTVAYQLHPSILDDLGLVVALRSWCAEFSRREGVQASFEYRDVNEPVPQDIASTVYRITQEALRNVSRHSGARTASVTLTGNTQGVELTVRDTGCGFNVPQARARAGLGLTSMEERARMLGGKFEIRSRLGRGTTITVRIPWSRGAL